MEIYPRKTYRWLTNTGKDAQHHSISEKGKSKPQLGTISHQSEWLLFKSLQAGGGKDGGGIGREDHFPLHKFLKRTFQR